MKITLLVSKGFNVQNSSHILEFVGQLKKMMEEVFKTDILLS